jgi:hypothetical protein
MVSIIAVVTPAVLLHIGPQKRYVAKGNKINEKTVTKKNGDAVKSCSFI